MTNHRDRESRADELARRVGELKRTSEDEPLAPALEALWAEIEGCFDALRKASTALVTAEAADQPPLLAQWHSQRFLLDSAFSLVEHRLNLQSSARYRTETFLESASAQVRATKAMGDQLVVFVDSLMGDSLMGDLLAKGKGDPELIRLLDVLSTRASANKEGLALVERALIDFGQRVRTHFGADRE